MQRSFYYAALLAIPIALVWGGCGDSTETNGSAAKPHSHENPFEGVNAAVCVMQATEGNNVSGTVTFTESGGKVKIVADIMGLTANQKHAIHIHEFGDLRKGDGTGTGGHYNPEGHEHGLTDKAERHAGDLGNLSADADGNAHYELEVDNITVAGEHNPILGRSIIIHAKEDDGGQPVGNAGPRIAQGVIGVANTK